MTYKMKLDIWLDSVVALQEAIEELKANLYDEELKTKAIKLFDQMVQAHKVYLADPTN